MADPQFPESIDPAEQADASTGAGAAQRGAGEAPAGQASRSTKSHRIGRTYYTSEVPINEQSTAAFFDQLESSGDLFQGPPPTEEEREEERRKHRAAARKHSSKRRKAAAPWWKRHKSAVVLLVIFALLLAAAGGAALWLRSTLNNVEHLGDPFTQVATRAPYATTTATEKPLTFLILGSDSRIDSSDPSQWEVGAQRTDTIMLAQISGDRKHVNVMSIPRDSWVTIPANQVIGEPSQAKINAAYSWGGPSLLIQTVENTTGIHIDHFAIANFESFKTLTDELGGVDITLTQPLDLTGKQDAASSSNVLQPGPHKLTGEQALIYARERYTLPRGDFDRIKRQQNWMRAILRQAVSDDVLTNPLKLTSFVSQVTKTTAVDNGLTSSAMISLAQSMTSIRPGDVAFFQAPTDGTGNEGGQSVIYLNAEGLAGVSAAFQNDTLTEYANAHIDQLDPLGSQVS